MIYVKKYSRISLFVPHLYSRTVGLLLIYSLFNKMAGARQQEETAKADALARDLSDKDVDNFWKTVHKMNSNSTVQANVTDVITGKTILLIIGDNTFIRY